MNGRTMSDSIYSVVRSSTNKMIMNNLYNNTSSDNLQSFISEMVEKNKAAAKATSTANASNTTTAANSATKKKTLDDYLQVSQAAFDAYQAEVDKGRSGNQQMKDLNASYSSIINNTATGGTYTAKTTKTSTIKQAISTEMLVGSLNK